MNLLQHITLTDVVALATLAIRLWEVYRGPYVVDGSSTRAGTTRKVARRSRARR